MLINATALLQLVLFEHTQRSSTASMATACSVFPGFRANRVSG